MPHRETAKMHENMKKSFIRTTMSLITSKGNGKNEE